MSDADKILILGGGPAGLGAAWRLEEAGYTSWELFERDRYVGGLAASRVDENGFTWDRGGHVVFSHYTYFDHLLDSLLERQWIEHVREAWVWMRERFIPYPLQNNIRHLPTPELVECLEGLVDCGWRPRIEVRGGEIPDCGLAAPGAARNQMAPPGTFTDWILRSFGAGLARVFLTPYNLKVWATDPVEMSASWVGERVATVDLKRILRNVIEGRDDLGWGPNATFRFPLQGGTGRIWQTLADRLPPDHLHLGAEVMTIDSRKKVVRLGDGREVSYDWLISTMPLDQLVGRILEPGLDPNPQSTVNSLRYSSTHVIGVGLAGPVPERLATKCWIYFPEPQLPFYRVTVFSNYSPHNVPRPGAQWSLLAEVSESTGRPVDQARVVPQVLDGLKAAQLIGPDDAIESLWHERLEHGYPTPTLPRDALLAQVEPALYARQILSRGRFGAWKYEVGNMDHSFMQGVEAANHILFGTPETTLRFPAVVNTLKPSARPGDRQK